MWCPRNSYTFAARIFRFLLTAAFGLAFTTLVHTIAAAPVEGPVAGARMNEKRLPIWSTRQLLVLVFFLYIGCVAFHLFFAIKGTPIYRDIHLGTALVYARTKINLLRPMIVGFNANNTPTPQELPVWQAAAGLAFKILGPWFGWANVVSLVLFSTCLYPLYQVAKSFQGERAACWTLVLFMVQPLTFFEAGVGSTDGFSLVTVIWFVFFAVRLIEKPGFGWAVLTALAGALAAVSKLPFFLAGGLGVFLLVLLHHRNSPRVWVWLGAAAIFAGVVFVGWTAYINSCYSRALYPFVDLRPTAANMKEWYYGNWSYRFGPGNWIKAGWRVVNSCFATPLSVGLCLAALLFLRKVNVGRHWLAGAIVSTAIFTHLVFVHWHYYLMYAPAAALLCGAAAAEIENRFSVERPWQSCLALAILTAVLACTVAVGMGPMKLKIPTDPYLKNLAPIVQKYCPENDKVLMCGGYAGWGGDEFILSHRDGLSIWTTKPLEDPEMYRNLKRLGYTHLVAISEAPLQVAYRITTPIVSPAPRDTYAKSLTGITTNWPTLYQDADIVVKELP